MLENLLRLVSPPEHFCLRRRKYRGIVVGLILGLEKTNYWGDTIFKSVSLILSLPKNHTALKSIFEMICVDTAK